MIKTVKIFTLIFMCVSLFSCTSNKGELTEKLTAEEQFEYFEQHNNEWKLLKPDLLELIAMKKELQELITELNKLADIPQIVTPMPTNTEQANLINAAPKSKKIPTNTISTNPPYAIQLGSYSQLSKLKQVWSDIQVNEAVLLNNKTAISEKTTKNKVTFYRLKAIPYDKESAKKACEILIKQQHSCIVSTPYGKAL
ncbi:SPOR domain-containing protein [Colwellia ponticola]|uniref:SPOR domain-containing protein n=1 Tax=Colwellia ponticola TaxID=2304625 RepID=A0A8H2JMN9_9GAMM|nr:SPOR domain-containing protein [Colwellia ponticola]TMM43115.1 SPOR domain-containing protein [Colwellia ponticola]